MSDEKNFNYILTNKIGKLVHLSFETKEKLSIFINENPYKFTEKELSSIRSAKDSDLKKIYENIKIKKKRYSGDSEDAGWSDNDY